MTAMNTALILGHVIGICIGLGCMLFYKTENSESKKIQTIQTLLVLILYAGLEGMAIYGVILGEFPGTHGNDPVSFEQHSTFFMVTLTFFSVMAGWLFMSFLFLCSIRIIGRR